MLLKGRGQRRERIGGEEKTSFKLLFNFGPKQGKKPPYRQKSEKRMMIPRPIFLRPGGKKKLRQREKE